MPGPIEIAAFFVVLGVLVFVHELGHFVAAKACGIYVDRFSLGMPPRIFGFKYGETDYCVGLLPIGGYVKMAGQEDAPLTEEEREETYGTVPPDRWFNNKPIWQRAVVLVAGPAMNIVLAIAIYMFMGAYGREVPLLEMDTRVGMVAPESPASQAPMYLVPDGGAADFTGEPDATGWQVGDRIVSINDEETTRFQDVIVAAVLGKNNESVVQIERLSADGSAQHFASLITPQIIDDSEATRFGIAPYDTALVNHVLPGSPAEFYGLLRGDEVLRANGVAVDKHSFGAMIRKLPPATEVTLQISRDGQLQEKVLQTSNEGRFKGIAFTTILNPMTFIDDNSPNEVVEKIAGLREGDVVLSVNGQKSVGTALRQIDPGSQDQTVQIEVNRRPLLGFLGAGGKETIELGLGDLIRALTASYESAEPIVAGVAKADAEATGLKRRDIILEIDGQPATVGLLREYETTRIGETVPVKAKRPSRLFGLVQREEIVEGTLTIASIQQVGVVWDLKTVFHREEAANVVPAALSESYRQVTQIGSILARLFTGNLSPKLLGGPVMIGEVVTTMAQIGFFYVLEITAVISVNLAIFNLLPLPVLDGGQLMFLVIEAVRRRPVSIRVAEAVQQAGFFLIIGLLLFVTFNDVSRIFTRWLN